MKLIRFGEAGKEKPGVIINDVWFDISEYINDYDEKFFENDGLSLLKTIISEKLPMAIGIKCYCFPTFKDLLAVSCHPFFQRECKGKGRTITIKIYFEIF